MIKDIKLCTFFLLINALVSTISYYTITHPRDDPRYVNIICTIVVYGNMQCSLGFLTGYAITRWLAIGVVVVDDM